MERRAKKHANRRARLRQLIIDRVGSDNMAEFARRYGYSRAQITQYASPTYNGGYSMGEGVVEKLEEVCGLPDGWFDWPADGSMDWPFKDIDEGKVRKLSPEALARFETAAIVAAQHVDVDIKKDG